MKKMKKKMEERGGGRREEGGEKGGGKTRKSKQGWIEKKSWKGKDNENLKMRKENKEKRRGGYKKGTNFKDFSLRKHKRTKYFDLKKIFWMNGQWMVWRQNHLKGKEIK